jgi:iron-sulfur cluster repair protein YtfE (RIC family)
MKRAEALAELSRDHHHGLVVAQRLRRADAGSAAGARAAFLDYWTSEGRTHFRVEEDVLLPAMARHHRSDDPAIVRVLVEHVDLRRRGADLEASADVPVDDLHALGERLSAHIRHEERVLFPMVEASFADDELSALGQALAAAHGT